MDIIQPPSSDIIPASVLTTQGDIIVRGVAAPARLGIGTTKQLLRVNAAANALEYGPLLGVPRSVLRVTDAGTDEIFTFLPDMYQKARIYIAAVDQSINTTTLTTISFDTDDYDSSAISDLGNKRIKPSLAGYYIVKYNIVITPPANIGYIVLYLRNSGNTETIIRLNHDVASVESLTLNAGYVAYFDGAANYADCAIYHNLVNPILIKCLRENTWLSVLGPF